MNFLLFGLHVCSVCYLVRAKSNDIVSSFSDVNLAFLLYYFCLNFMVLVLHTNNTTPSVQF